MTDMVCGFGMMAHLLISILPLKHDSMIHSLTGGIGRGGPVVWPPRSPDLPPLDFFSVALTEESTLL